MPLAFLTSSPRPGATASTFSPRSRVAVTSSRSWLLSTPRWGLSCAQVSGTEAGLAAAFGLAVFGLAVFVLTPAPVLGTVLDAALLEAVLEPAGLPAADLGPADLGAGFFAPALGAALRLTLPSFFFGSLPRSSRMLRASSLLIPAWSSPLRRVAFFSPSVRYGPKRPLLRLIGARSSYSKAASGAAAAPRPPRKRGCMNSASASIIEVVNSCSGIARLRESLPRLRYGPNLPL